jgi:hypothetical protein
MEATQRKKETRRRGGGPRSRQQGGPRPRQRGVPRPRGGRGARLRRRGRVARDEPNVRRSVCWRTTPILLTPLYFPPCTGRGRFTGARAALRRQEERRRQRRRRGETHHTPLGQGIAHPAPRSPPSSRRQRFFSSVRAQVRDGREGTWGPS